MNKNSSENTKIQWKNTRFELVLVCMRVFFHLLVLECTIRVCIARYRRELDDANWMAILQQQQLQQ